MTTHEPIHYVPVVEQRYAEIVQNLVAASRAQSVEPVRP